MKNIVDVRGKIVGLMPSYTAPQELGFVFVKTREGLLAKALKLFTGHGSRVVECRMSPGLPMSLFWAAMGGATKVRGRATTDGTQNVLIECEFVN